MKPMITNIIHRIPGGLVISAITAMALIPGSCNLNGEWERYYGDAPGHTTYTVLDLIEENPEFSKFYDALIEYGFDDLLTKNQYFTVFVPANTAFEGLPE
jgi:uncharacterized surface protein with fasciclin (FAS1) repeats